MWVLDRDNALKWLQSIHPSIEPLLSQYKSGECSYEHTLAKIVPHIYQWYSHTPSPCYYRQLYGTVASILQQLRPRSPQKSQNNGNQNIPESR